MRKPDFKHIIAFIAERNSFVLPEEIITNQIDKTGKSKGIVRPYIYTTLNRLKKRGQISEIRDFDGRILWGLPGWTDFNGFPLDSHKPLQASIVEGRGLFEVNPQGVTRNSFLSKKKFKA